MKEHVWQRASQLAVSGPLGWAPVERLDVVRVDGTARVTVETWSAGSDALEAVAEQHGAAFAATVDGWSDSGVASAPVLRRPGLRRRCGWVDPDGHAVAATIDYQLDAGSVFVLVTADRSDDLDTLAEAEQVAASVVTTRMFDLTETPAVDVAESGMPPVWEDVRRSWAQPNDAQRTDVSPQPHQTRRITFEEAIAAARQNAATSFPGVDAAFLAPLGTAGAEVARRVAARSLESRVADDPGLASSLSVAAAHDLLVVCERMDRAALTSTWCAVRPDVAVLITPDPDAGSVTLDDLAPEALIDVVLAGVKDAPSPHRGSHEKTTRSDVAALLAGRPRPAHGAGPSLLGHGPVGVRRVRTVYRVGALITGGELEWLDAGEAGLWRITDADDTANGSDVGLDAVSADDLHSALLGILPGADTQPVNEHERQP